MKFLKPLSLLGVLFALTFAAQADPLAVGSPAPAITAIDQDGKPVKFSEVYAKGPTLVYFYPKAKTGGCTAQGCSLRDSWTDLQAKGVQVLGVSEDDAALQKSFRDEQHFPFPLIADADGKVAQAFGVTMRGPKMTTRQSFLIRDGKVAWNMLANTSTKTHGADVLKAVESTAK